MEGPHFTLCKNDFTKLKFKKETYRRNCAKVERQVYTSHQVQSYGSNHAEPHPVDARDGEKKGRSERSEREVKARRSFTNP